MPRPEIAAYIAEVSQPGIPYISRSHVTLLRLNALHGTAQVNAWLAEYWAHIANKENTWNTPQPRLQNAQGC